MANELTSAVLAYKKSKDIKERNDLIIENLPLVFKFLRKNNYFFDEDILHECVIIFIKAIESFKYKQDYEFSTWLYLHLKSIYKYCMFKTTVVTIKDGGFNFEAVKNGDTSCKYVADVLNAKNSTVCIDDVVDLPYQTNDDDFEIPEKTKDKLLSILNEKEQFVIRMSLFNNFKMNNKQISKLLETSKQSVSLIKLSAESKIRDFLRSDKISEPTASNSWLQRKSIINRQQQQIKQYKNTGKPSETMN